MIDELAHAGQEHLDVGFVAAYDRKQGFDPSEDVSVLRRHDLDARSTLVDLGAGTGRFALAAAAVCGRVVAADVSPVMLDLLRRRVAETGVANVECVRAGLLTYERAGPLADAVYTRNALHQLPDFWKGVALDRISQMLRPGGLLLVRDLIFDFQPSQADEMIERWLDGAARDPADGYTREELAEHVRSEYSTYRWLFEPLLIAAGFEIVEASFRRSVYGSYTCVRR
jgi:ubiquinone/menaquinone biosynthesis C-methylase UbiE